MKLRQDLARISAWITPGSTVLDLGCGDGTLLAHLAQTRQVTGYGVEIDAEGVRAAVRQGVNALQMDLESGLSVFPDQSFDFVVLSLTLQAMKRTESVVREMMRVAHTAIVSFPNFAYWRHRLDVLKGHMPKSGALPYEWHDTPNVHLCTLADFEVFCRRLGLCIDDRVVLAGEDEVRWLPNLRGSLAMLRVSRAA
jgi:methionine biosynthesis protein MetW